VDLIYLRMCSIKCGEFLNNMRNYHLLKGTVLPSVIYLPSVFNRYCTYNQLAELVCRCSLCEKKGEILSV